MNRLNPKRLQRRAGICSRKILETLKTRHMAQENRWGLLSGHVRIDVLRKAPETTLLERINSKPQNAMSGAPSLLLVNGRLRTLFERLAVPDHALAVVARKLEILGSVRAHRSGKRRLFHHNRPVSAITYTPPARCENMHLNWGSDGICRSRTADVSRCPIPIFTVL